MCLAQGHNTATSVRLKLILHVISNLSSMKWKKYCKFRNFSKGFIFAKLRSFVKIKSSRIGEITLSFTDIGISRPCHEFSRLQICVLMLFAKIKFSRIFPNLQYNIKFVVCCSDVGLLRASNWPHKPEQIGLARSHCSLVIS